MKNLLFQIRRLNAKIATFFLRDNIILTSASGLGFCSALAVTNKVSNAIVMAIGVFFVAMLSCFAVWPLKPFLKTIGRHHRITVYMVVVSALVTIFSLFAQLLVPQIALDIKAYIGLIITNCIILGLVDAFGSSHVSFLGFQGEIFKKVLGYSFALICISVLREALGFGTILGNAVMPEWWPLATLAVTPIGGFFGLAIWRMILRPISINRKFVCQETASSSKESENAFDWINKKTAFIFLGGIILILSALFGLHFGGVNVPYEIMFGALFLDGIVLSKLLGMCPLLSQSKSMGSAWKMGAAVVFVVTCATSLNWFLYNNFLVQANQYIRNYMPFFKFEELFDLMMYIFVIATFVQIIEKIIGKISKELKESMGIFLPLITVNCVVLGSSLFRIPVSATLLEAVMYGFGDGLHWALVCVLLSIISTQGLRIPIKSWDRDTIVILALGIIASIWTIFGQLVIG